MPTIKIDPEDRLVNGLVGKVMYLRYVNDEVKVICVEFNDQIAGQQSIQGSNQFSTSKLGTYPDI